MLLFSNLCQTKIWTILNNSALLAKQEKDNTSKITSIAIAQGDGIGPEIMKATLKIQRIT